MTSRREVIEDATEAHALWWDDSRAKTVSAVHVHFEQVGCSCGGWNPGALSHATHVAEVIDNAIAEWERQREPSAEEVDAAALAWHGWEAWPESPEPVQRFNGVSRHNAKRALRAARDTRERE